MHAFDRVSYVFFCIPQVSSAAGKLEVSHCDSMLKQRVRLRGSLGHCCARNDVSVSRLSKHSGGANNMHAFDQGSNVFSAPRRSRRQLTRL